MLRQTSYALVIAVAASACAAVAQVPGVAPSPNELGAQPPAPGAPRALPAPPPPAPLGAKPLPPGAAPGSPPPPPGLGCQQTPAAEPGALPVPPGMGGAGPKAFAATTVTGKVKSYLLNPGGQVDGLLMADGKQLHFPPHMGTALQQAARPGDSVQATVEMGNQSQYGQECRTISLTNPKTGATVIDQPPLSPPPPPTPGEAITAKGTVGQWLVGHMGEVNGFLLSDGTQIHFPPHLGFALNQQLKLGDAVAVQGYGTRTAVGSSLDLASVSINGKPLPVYGFRP